MSYECIKIGNSFIEVIIIKHPPYFPDSGAIKKAISLLEEELKK